MARIFRFLDVRCNPLTLPVMMLALALMQTIPARAERGPHVDACQAIEFEETSFTACRYDARRDELRLMLDAPDGWPLRHLPALANSLGPDKHRARFAMNAGMYDQHGRPLGLYVEGGKEHKPLNREQGKGNFHLDPNGVFSVGKDGGVNIIPSGDWAKVKRRPAFATQSGPMLIIKNRLHPAFEDNGSSHHYRNGVGVVDGKVAWFVISEDRVSFGRFARLFRDRLKCRDALYFDGAVSSLWFPGEGRMDSNFALGPMLLVNTR